MINYSKIFDELFLLNRSLLGEGYLKSLKIINRYIKLKFLKYKSGSKVFDWIVPKEWVVKKAYIKFKGKKILDYKNSNLHIINYSNSINKKVKLNELKSLLHSIPKQPKVIPYITSYYKKDLGFCSSHNFKKKLKNGTYHCVIDSYFKKSYLVNGISDIKGKSNKTNLITTYLCHPSMANNELSGPLVMIGLYNRIKKWKSRNYSYKFLVNPETIGSLCFLKSHGQIIKKNFNSGIVLTCLGGKANRLSYKLSKSENSTLDNTFKLFSKDMVKIRKFDPSEGSDERQYNSPGFNLPVGNVCRSVYGSFKEYHNSGDNKKFMSIKKIEDSINTLEHILKLHDYSLPIKRYIPYGELMLGKRGLYPNKNSEETRNKSGDSILGDREELNILLTILSYSDGNKNIIDIINQKNLNIKKSFKVLETSLDQKLTYFKN
tara:strand:+ start:484 stop:1782 length:1299 start_codon:yes stop_codon:yes gene_type:complete